MKLVRREKQDATSHSLPDDSKRASGQLDMIVLSVSAIAS